MPPWDDKDGGTLDLFDTDGEMLCVVSLGGWPHAIALCFAWNECSKLKKRDRKLIN